MFENDIKRAIGRAALRNDALTYEIIMYTDWVIEELTERAGRQHEP